MKSKDLVIRDYRDADFPEIDQLWTDTGMGGAARADDGDAIRRTLSQGGRLFVLEETRSKKIIGTSWLTRDGRRIYLHHFCISPAHQGNGFARSLLDASLQFAESTGLQIKLEVHKSNEKAIRLYQKAGFKYLGDYLVYIIRDYESIK